MSLHITFQNKLPIDDYLPKICSSIKNGRDVIIRAEPGAGKTTRVPAVMLLKQSELSDASANQEILVIEPRRLAAKLSAERVAFEMGVKCGDRVGYQVRFGSKISSKTNLKFVTEGIFLRIIEDNPTLENIGCVILDEFHERNIQTDLALMLTRFLQTTKRPDIRLILMSATIELNALQKYLPDADVFDIPGRTFPLTIKHVPPQHYLHHHLPSDKDIEQVVKKMMCEESFTGHVLFFVPGMREITRYCNLLQKVLPSSEFDVLPLSAGLSLDEQAKIFSSSVKRKLIVSTNVAETSVTIPGITGVIDTGLAKIASQATWSGFTTLDIKRIAKSSCTQRAGRAGRTAPGIVYRLYSENDFLGREPETSPDIKRLDFSPYLLSLLSLKQKWSLLLNINPSFKDLPWFEPPEDHVILAANDLLQRLCAIDNVGNLTPTGFKLASIPLHPRLGAIILSAINAPVIRNVVLACSIINEGFFGSQLDDTSSESASCDICFQIELLKDIVIRKKKNCRDYDKRKVQRIVDLYSLLMRKLGIEASLPAEEAIHEQLIPHFFVGFSDRLGKLRSSTKVQHRGSQLIYNFCQGRGGILSGSSVVKDASWIIALDSIETQDKDASIGVNIQFASLMTPEVLKGDPGHFVYRKSVDQMNDHTGKIETFSCLMYGELELERRREASNSENSEEKIASFMKLNWPKPFSDDIELKTYQAKRYLLMSKGFDISLPSFNEPDLFELLLHTISDGKMSFEEILSRTLGDYINDVLSYEASTLLKQKLPDQFIAINKKKFQIHFDESGAPWIEGYIQDFYGIKTTPKILDGQLSLSLRLLAPNKRPVQITSDLENFWKKTYAELKSEYQRQYPKHYWPENPGFSSPILLKRNVQNR